MQEDNAPGGLIEGVVDAQHADGHAVRVLFGEVDGFGAGTPHVVNTGSACRRRQLRIRWFASSVGDDTAVAGSFNRPFDVDDVLVPKFALLDTSVAIIGSSCSLSPFPRFVIVPDVEHDDVGFAGLPLHLLLRASARHGQRPDRQKKDDERVEEGGHMVVRWGIRGSAVLVPGRGEKLLSWRRLRGALPFRAAFA